MQEEGRLVSIQAEKSMEEKTFQRIKELTELQGTSGFEHDIRAYMREAMTPLVDEIQQDGLGGIFGLRHHSDADAPVSYTHLTLPTKRIVELSVGAVSLTKKKKKQQNRT